MGLSESDIAYRPGLWGSWAARLFFGSLFASFFWAVLNVAIRGIQIAAADTSPLVPAFVAGGSYFLLAWAFLRVNGGFIYWTQVLALYVVGAIAYALGAEHRYIQNGQIMTERIFAGANRYVKNLHAVSLVWYSLAMIAGSYLGSLFAWGITDGWVVPSPNFDQSVYAPGAFGTPDAGFVVRALIVEIIGMIIISAVVTYFYLIDRADLAPAAGGFAVFVSTLLAFNISGGAFDIVYWTFHHLAVCTAGTVCFAGASQWWGVYLAGSLGGAGIGVILALVVYLLSPLVRAGLTMQSGVASTAQAVNSARQQFASRQTSVPMGTDASVPMVAAGATGGPTGAATAALFGSN